MVEIFFICKACEELKLNHDEVYTHLSTVHGIVPPISGIKRGIMFLDGPGWYQNIYEIRINDDLVLMQTISGKRK